MDDNPKQFLDKAVERKLLTAEQAEEAVRIYQTVRDVGIEQPIDEILAKKGFMSADQVRALRRELSGMRVGKYRILEKLGEGGAGIVYRATQEPLDRTVAIKVLSKHRVGSPEYLERFSREARVAVTLNHLNIVRGLDHGEADGYHYFVMEYVEGDSLADLLKREGNLDEKRAIELTLQAVAALRHAAEFDLVHRDIKPENILITKDGVAKVCDLGLAKPSVLDSTDAAKDGTTIGTPVYMSPEQIRGKDDADFRSDVYSLGVTLYEMVTGRPPFLGETTDIIVRKHIRETPMDPRERNLNLSSSIAAVILKMLAKKPEDRYASLKDLDEDLRAVLDGRPPRHTIQMGGKRPTGKVRVEVDEGVSRRVRITEKKRSPIPLVVIGVLVLVAGGVAFILKPWEAKTPGPTDTGQGTGATPGVNPGPKPEEEAEELYREAVAFEEENRDAALDSIRDRYDLVVKRFPLSRWSLMAKDRLRRIDAEEQAGKERFLRDARQAYEDLVAEAETLIGASRYGDALERLSQYPEKYADTEYPERLERDRQRILAAVQARADALLAEADTQMKLGRFAEARETLSAVSGLGVVEYAAKVEAKAQEIRENEEAEAKAREQGLEIFRSVVGATYLRAAVGEYAEAEEDLIKAMERPKLTYFRGDLETAWRDLRASLRFAEALEIGAQSLTGEVVRLTLRTFGRKEAGGKVLGANSTGIRLARGNGEELIRYRDMSAPDLIRIAFLALAVEQAEDHAGAALYLIVQGHVLSALKEIEAAKMLGADPEPLLARRDLIERYLLDRAEALIRKAEVYRLQERPVERLDHLLKAVDMAPFDARARLLLGAALVTAKRNEDALDQLDLAVALGSKEPALLFHRAEALIALRRATEALAAYREFLQVAPESDPLREVTEARITEIEERVIKDIVKDLNTEARVAFREEDWDEAVRLYLQIHELAPKEEESLYFLGRAYVESNRILLGYLALKEYLVAEPSGRRSTDARRQVKSLERLYEDNVESRELNGLGRGAYEIREFDDALQYFNRAVAIGPLNAEIYYNRAETWIKLGELSVNDRDFEIALEDLETVTRLDPEDKDVLPSQALCYYYLNRQDEALEKAKEAMRALPSDWRGYNLAGLVYHGMKEYEEAGRIFDRCLRFAPDVVTLYINRALAYEGEGKYTQALKTLEKAGQKHPSDADIRTIDSIAERVTRAMEEDD
jgi:eukaryotic-like serine/threonine-protein kinase